MLVGLRARRKHRLCGAATTGDACGTCSSGCADYSTGESSSIYGGLTPRAARGHDDNSGDACHANSAAACDRTDEDSRRAAAAHRHNAAATAASACNR